MSIQAGCVTVATIGQCAALIDITRCAYTQVSIQVLEVVRVADVGVINFRQQARSQACLVLPAVHPALIFVIRLQLTIIVTVVEVRAANLTFAVLGEVAEFAFHHQAAIAHIGRVQRCVIVWRKVEVVRRLQGQAIIA